MASGMLRNALCEVIEGDSCVEGSERCTRMREEAKKILTLTGDDSKKGVFQDFSEELVSVIKTCLAVSGQCRSVAAWREKAQANFHKVRISKIPGMWGRLYSQVDMKMKDPLLLQSVSQRVFSTLLLQHMSSIVPSRSPAVRLELLNREEDNALRYACGYVPFKLLRKYKSQSSNKAMQFVSCLTNMTVC